MQLSAPLSALLSGGSIIDLDGTIFVQLGQFVIAFVVLYALVFRPVMALLDAREEAIDGSRAEARRLETDITTKQGQYEEELTKVRAASHAEHDRLKSEGQKTERAVIDKVRQETQGLLSETQARLDREADEARKELKVRVPILASQIATKILGREVKA